MARMRLGRYDHDMAQTQPAHRSVGESLRDWRPHRPGLVMDVDGRLLGHAATVTPEPPPTSAERRLPVARPVLRVTTARTVPGWSISSTEILPRHRRYRRAARCDPAGGRPGERPGGPPVRPGRRRGRVHVRPQAPDGATHEAGQRQPDEPTLRRAAFRSPSTTTTSTRVAASSTTIVVH